MVHRIKWEEDIIKNPDGKEVPNKCVLVWKVRIFSLYLLSNIQTLLFTRRFTYYIYFFSSMLSGHGKAAEFRRNEI